MMIEGHILMIVGAIAMLAGPASRALAASRAPELAHVAEALRAAFPLPAPKRSLERLAERAEAKLAGAESDAGGAATD